MQKPKLIHCPAVHREDKKVVALTHHNTFSYQGKIHRERGREGKSSQDEGTCYLFLDIMVGVSPHR